MVAVTGNPYRHAAEFRADLRRFLRRSEECARANGITPRQHLVLLQIAGAPGGTTTISQLVDALSLTQSAVTELVQRAEQAGLVRRTGSTQDGRVVHLSLTDEGAAKLATVQNALGPERVHLKRVVDALDEG